jgi:nicotinate-nucleotide adenylyltransferase
VQIGIFGGSFDPVHYGHLRVAEACRNAVPLDTVLFVPAAAQPLKPHGPVASADNRLRMLELAIEGRRGLDICPIEIERGGVSYTVDTLRQLVDERPGDEVYLILGADALGDLPNWREPETIRRLARFVVVDRPGACQIEPPQRAESGEASAVSRSVIHVPIEPQDVSSSEIRSRVARGESIAGLLPPSVAAYIERKQLYRS